MSNNNNRFNRFILATVSLITLTAILGFLSTNQSLARFYEPHQVTSGVLMQTPKPVPPIGQATADDGPQLHITTSGAVGTPVSFRLPPSSKPASLGIAVVQSPNDWRADFTEDFEEGLSTTTWQVIDQSDDGSERYWGADDYYANSGTQSIWVAAGGTDALDPETSYYPPNLDTWLVTQSPFDLSAAQMADAEFYMFMDTEPQYDWIFVGASVDGENFSGEYWTGNSGGWQYYNLDLSEFIGYSEVYLAWYFHSDESNAEGKDYEGIWLDDITVWTYVDTGPPQGNESMENGNFETGDLTSWTKPDGSTVEVTEAANPVSGNYVARFGGTADANEILYQPVTVPDSDVTSASIGFWVNLFGEETNAGVDLFCAGLYNSDMSTLLLDLGCLDGVEVTGSTFNAETWRQVDYPLTGEDWNTVKGQTVNVAFEMWTDSDLNTTVLLDDVTLEVVSGGSAGDASEPNDSRAEATAATVGTRMTDLTIDPAGDFDFFSFSGNANDTVSADIDAAVNGSSLDSYVWLLDADGNVVCENDDDGNTYDSYLTCKLTSSGTHYVKVSSYDGSGDRSYAYSVLINVSGGSEPPPTPPPTPEPTPEPTPPPSGTKKWTAILYIDGDNNLCDSYPSLITRIENELGSKLNDFLNVAVLFDRDPNHCSSGGTTRYLVQPGGNYTDGTNRWDMGERNMGDPQTLISFAKWAMQNYPAEHYYLAIDNHGGGISGIAWDDTDNHDNLSNDELYTALKEITQNGSQKLDVFAYEACLMGMYENAYDIRQFTDYVFFFPTISWTNNASYPSYLGHANFTANATGRQLGEIIFDVYYDAVTNPYAVSLIDASQMAVVQTAVDNWANALADALSTSKSGMTTARSNAQKIDVNNDDMLSDADSYIDLWDLADKMAAQGIATAESAALKSAVDNATVRDDQRSYGDLDYANTHGLSIYWPQTASGSYSAYVNDQIYNATRDGKWDEFLESYFGGSSRGGMPTDPGHGDREPATTVTNYVYLPLVMRN